MTLDVSQLIKRKEKVLNISLTLDSSNFFKDNTEIKVNKPVLVEGTVTMVGDILHFDAKVKTELQLQCSRCTEMFVYPVDVEVHEELTNNGDNKDDNIIFIDSDNIDITEMVENNIFLILPIKKLCSEDCKGLCQQCGVNLNIKTCNCDNVEIDSRLSKLKDFFSTD